MKFHKEGFPKARNAFYEIVEACSEAAAKGFLGLLFGVFPKCSWDLAISVVHDRVLMC